MIIPITEAAEPTGLQKVPSWIKNNAGWWADGQIDDSSFVLGIQWLISNGIIIIEEKLVYTDLDFRVAFIGDQGLGPDAIAVLNLIKDEGAHMVLHQGDFDYRDDPEAWDKMISDVLGDDFPYFGTIGSHDTLKWNEYQLKLYDRLKKNPDAECIGDLGVKSSCTYKGLFFIQVGPNLKGSGHSSFIEKQLNKNDHIWRVCSWSNTMTAMQLGMIDNEVGWEVYENCKNGAGIIATAHEHSYSRTKTLSDIENQIVDAHWSAPDKLIVKEGSTFVFVSGAGGVGEIRNQDRCLPISYPYGCKGEWASIYTSDQGAKHGALFCTFNPFGQPNDAYCYFKNIDGEIIDEFTVTNLIGVDDTNFNLPKNDLSNTDLSGRDMTSLILINADLSYSNLANTDFTKTILIKADLSYSNLANTDFTETILIKADLSYSNLANTDFTDANLAGVDLSDNDLTGTVLTRTDLSYSNLNGVNLANKDMTGTVLIGADLTDANLAGVDLSDRDMSRTILRGMDLSNKDMSDTILREADLTDANLAGVDLSDKDLTGTVLRGVDLSNKDLSDTILREADLTGAVLPSDYLTAKDFGGTIFNGVDLSGKNMAEADFEIASFDNTNLKNADLRDARFLNVDLTKIKNKSLAETDLRYTVFAYSNLVGLDLNGAKLHRNNFQHANLAGLDFTVIKNKNNFGSTFNGADLSNANFDGVNLFEKDEQGNIVTRTVLIPDWAYKVDQKLAELHKDLYELGNYGVFVTKRQAVGNDLVLWTSFLTDFVDANLANANLSNAVLSYSVFLDSNLANANLSNAELEHAVFLNANLANANLSNADLSNTTIKNTDLTNADLTNADLTNADLGDFVILDGTILDCKNHPVCVG